MISFVCTCLIDPDKHAMTAISEALSHKCSAQTVTTLPCNLTNLLQVMPYHFKSLQIVDGDTSRLKTCVVFGITLPGIVMGFQGLCPQCRFHCVHQAFVRILCNHASLGLRCWSARTPRTLYVLLLLKYSGCLQSFRKWSSSHVSGIWLSTANPCRTLFTSPV